MASERRHASPLSENRLAPELGESQDNVAHRPDSLAYLPQLAAPRRRVQAARVTKYLDASDRYIRVAVIPGDGQNGKRVMLFCP